MSIRNVLLTLAAAGAVGLGALMMTPSKKDAKPSLPVWQRVTRLAEKVDHPLGLVVDGDFVYFVTGGFEKADNAVKRVPAAGGPVETLASGDFISSGHLALDEGFVYWTSEWPGSVMRVAKTGGPVTTLAENKPRPTFLAVDGQHVYFSTYAKEPPGGTLERVSKQGGAPEILASGHPYVSGVVVDGTDVFWTSALGLWRLAKAGGTATRLSPEKLRVTRLVADAHDLFFFARSTDFDKDFAVTRLPKTGGDPAALSPPAEWNLSLGLSRTHVYFFLHGSGRGEYVLQRAQKTGGSPETVDVGGIPSGHLSLDDGNVYFTDLQTVYRVPK
jgi:hypothetical protein